MAVTQQRGRVSAETDGKLPKRLSLDLPMLSIEVRRPEVRLPHVAMPHLGMPHISKQEMGHYVDVARTFIPPPERIAYYGALGALAVFGVVDWPVAAAIGAGTIIAQRGRRRAPSASMWPRGTQPPAPTPTPAQQATTSTRRRTATTSGTAAGRKTATTADTTAGRKTATTSGTTAGRKTATTSGTTAGRRKSATQSR